jgi:ArsR family transcriptional regulator, arsenate/arsenite/antimonite-responsive transcriptional repressor
MTNNKSQQFDADLQEIASFAKILSHPARIAIIKILAEKKEIRTGNISDFLPIGRTTVSKHLKDMKKMGIIQGTIDGLKIHYCLDGEYLEKVKRSFNNFFEKSINDCCCKCNCNENIKKK